jgi:hypothetical protein
MSAGKPRKRVSEAPLWGTSGALRTTLSEGEQMTKQEQLSQQRCFMHPQPVQWELSTHQIHRGKAPSVKT